MSAYRFVPLRCHFISSVSRLLLQSRRQNSFSLIADLAGGAHPGAGADPFTAFASLSASGRSILETTGWRENVLYH